jgi:hypothetical protein
MQYFPLSPTLFSIYIDKLEDCLEDVCCVSLTLASIVIILLLYADDIFLMEKIPYDLGKKLIIHKEFCSSMGMTMNIEKTKVMIIKSKRITYNTFNMTKIAWRKFLHKNIESIFTTSLIGNIALRKG